jgi:hypothetical protein
MTSSGWWCDRRRFKTLAQATRKHLSIRDGDGDDDDDDVSPGGGFNP